MRNHFNISILLFSLIIISPSLSWAQHKGLVIPKGHTPLQLFYSRANNASSILLSTDKGTATTIWKVASEKFKKELKPTSPPLLIEQNQVWIQSGKALQVLNLSSGELLATLTLPNDIDQVTAMTIGVKGELFIADATVQKLYTFQKEKWDLLAEGSRLGKPSALLYTPTQLFIGTDVDLRVYSFETEFVTSFTHNLKEVTSLAMDHTNHVVALTKKDGKLLRIDREGKKKQLPIQATGITSFILDPYTNSLISMNTRNQQVMRVDYLKLIGKH